MRLRLVCSLIGLSLGALSASCSSEDAASRSGEQMSNAQEDEGKKVTANGVTSKYTYYLDVKPILDQYCVTCHGPDPVEGAGEYYRLSQYETSGFIQGAYALRGPIKARLRDGSMPPAGSDAPTQKQIDIVTAWVDGAAPAGDPSDAQDTGGGGGDNSRGKVILTSPIASSEAPDSNNIFPIKVSFSGYYNSFTWDVAYFPEGNPSLTRTIATGLSKSQTSYDFDLSALPSGRYGIRVRVEDKDFFSPGFIDFNNPGSNNNNPTVSLTGDWLGGGGQVISTANPIGFSASDVNGDSLTVKIELSSDGGKTYSTALANTTSTDGYSWNAAASGVQEGIDYRIRLTVSDQQGGKTTIASQRNVALGNKLYTWKNDVYPTVLGPLCSSCHRNRPYDSDLYSGPNGAYRYRNSVVEMTVNESMPNNNRKASGRQKEILQLWLMQGAAEE